MDDLWFAWGEPGPHAAVRLFCLPYAGGSAAVYRTLRDLAPAHVEVCPLELPGRGRRIGEAPATRAGALAARIAAGLRPYADRPFALFGHSMGGLLAFEVARALRRTGAPQPVRLFVSGAAAPDVPRARPAVHLQSDDEVVAELRWLGGTPPEMLDDAELMQFMLPTLRADFAILETYAYRDEPPLDVPITVFGGTSDPLVPATGLHHWRRHTSAGSRLQLLPGEHFFVHTAAAQVMASVGAALPQAPSPAGRAAAPPPIGGAA